MVGFNEKLDSVVDVLTEKLKDLSNLLDESSFEVCKDQLEKNFHENSIKASDINV